MDIKTEDGDSAEYPQDDQTSTGMFDFFLTLYSVHSAHIM